MEIRQLQYFVTVVNEGTVTAAAKTLHMTQPPLTSQLHMLEAELGCALFQRDGRKLKLTEAGQHLYLRASEILGMCDTVREEMGDFREGVTGTLRLGVISSLQGIWFTNCIRTFKQQYPDVALSFHSANSYELLNQLHNRTIDLTFIRTPFSGSGLDILNLHKEPMLAIGHRSFFADLPDEAISIRALSQKPLIIYRRWQKLILDAFESVECTPNIDCVNDTASLTLLLASQGLGVGLLHPSVLPEHQNSELTVRILKEDILSSQIALICKSKKDLPQTARLFWEHLEQTPMGVSR